MLPIHVRQGVVLHKYVHFLPMLECVFVYMYMYVHVCVLFLSLLSCRQTIMVFSNNVVSGV